MSRHLEVLGTAAGALSSSNPCVLRLLRRSYVCDAALRRTHRKNRLAGSFLFLRLHRYNMVHVLAVVGLRETVQTSDHRSQRTVIHRKFARGHAKVLQDTDAFDYALEGVLHFDARLRHLRGEFLQIVELLPARFVSSFLHQ